MNGRERLLCTLSGQLADRIPVALFVQQEYLSYYFGKTETDRITDVVVLAKELGFELMTRQTTHIEPHFLRRSYLNWDVQKKSYIENNNMYKITSIQTPGGKLEQIEAAPYDARTIGGIHFTTIRHMIQTTDDFELFKRYMPSIQKEDVDNMHEAAKKAEAAIGDAGIACPWGTGGVYNTASALRSMTDLMCDPYEDEGFYLDFIELLTSIIERDYSLLAGTEYSCIGMQGNIANGGLVGEDFFRKYILPYEKRVVDAVKAEGKYVLYHNCGPARRLYNCYIDLGMTVFETMSPSPQGDNDLAEAKKILGEHMVLSGNLDQISFLKTATPEQVAKATEEIVSIGKPGGRYIFSTSDYLEADTPVENVKSMISAAKSSGRY